MLQRQELQELLPTAGNLFPHASLSVMLADAATVPADIAAQVVVDGISLARYRYDVLKSIAGTAESDDDVTWHPAVAPASARGCSPVGSRLQPCRGKWAAALTLRVQQETEGICNLCTTRPRMPASSR